MYNKSVFVKTITIRIFILNFKRFINLKINNYIMINFNSDKESLESYNGKYFHQLPFEHIDKFREVFFILKGDNLNKSLENELKTRFNVSNPDLVDIVRFKNSLNIFFSDKYWNTYTNASITPQKFYEKFKLDIEKLSSKNNKLNFENILNHNPEEKDIIKLEIDRLNQINDRIIKVISETYTSNFKIVHKLE